MSRDEKIAHLLLQLEDNDNLRILLRSLLLEAVANLDDENLDKVYATLNPYVEPAS